MVRTWWSGKRRLCCLYYLHILLFIVLNAVFNDPIPFPGIRWGGWRERQKARSNMVVNENTCGSYWLVAACWTTQGQPQQWTCSLHFILHRSSLSAHEAMIQRRDDHFCFPASFERAGETLKTSSVLRSMSLPRNWGQFPVPMFGQFTADTVYRSWSGWFSLPVKELKGRKDFEQNR